MKKIVREKSECSYQSAMQTRGFASVMPSSANERKKRNANGETRKAGVGEGISRSVLIAASCLISGASGDLVSMPRPSYTGNRGRQNNSRCFVASAAKVIAFLDCDVLSLMNTLHANFLKRATQDLYLYQIRDN